MMIPGYVRFIIFLVSFVSLIITNCGYYTFTVWEGTCSATTLTSDTSFTYVNLSCPGISGVSKPPATKDFYVVMRVEGKTIPTTFNCKVTRPGEAFCNLRKK